MAGLVLVHIPLSFCSYQRLQTTSKYTGNFHSGIAIVFFIFLFWKWQIFLKKKIFLSHVFGSIRGRLASMTLLSRNIGILCGYIFGATIQYHYIPIISASIFIIFIILFTLQPNSPRYYIRKKQFEVSNSIFELIFLSIVAIFLFSHLRFKFTASWKCIETLQRI